MSKFLIASIAAAVLGVTGVHPAAAQVTADPAAVKSGGFKLEPFHTQVGFTISHLGISNYSGVFHDAAGTLTLDPANLGVSKLNVTVPVASLISTVPALDTELKGKGWFDAAAYPTATFISTKVTRTGANSAVIEGDLTLHGVTRPVKLDAQLVGSGVNVLNKTYSVGFVAKGSIKRSDFGIKTYLPVLADDVDLTIQAAFEAKS